MNNYMTNKFFQDNNTAGQQSLTNNAFGKEEERGNGSCEGQYRDFSCYREEDAWQSQNTGGWRNSDADLKGSSIGDTYLIRERIGAGSGGVVYLAWHRRLKKQVVLKKIKVPHRDIEENRREADILKQLRHSYLPGVIDFINVSGEVYTVMDYIEGESLQTRLRNGQRFSREESVKYVCQLLEALDYLHGQPIPVVHGDIKPSNIMLTPDGNICLIDFNISGYLTDNRMLVTGYTEGYASPEQELAIREAIRSGRPVRPEAIDTRSDLFSAGAVLFTLLTGEKPGSEWAQMQLILEHERISDGIIQVLFRALRFRPEERYATAAEMLRELSNYKKLESGYKKKMMRGRIFVCAAAAVLILAFLAGAVILQSRRKGKEKEYQGTLASLEALAEDAERESKQQNGAKPGETSSGNADSRENIFGQSAYEEVITLYSECISLYPYRIAPLVGTARFLAATGRDDECIRLIRGDAFLDQNPSVGSETATAYGKLYYLLGSCYDRTGNREEAAQAFGLAVEMDETNPDYFRDYAIVLAQTGNSTKAEEILRKAEQNGLVQSQICLVRGEILINEGKYTEAVKELVSCIRETDNDTDLLRAYMLSAEAYEQMGITQDNMHSAVDLLEEARSCLPTDQMAPVLERLAQCYINLYNLTEDSAQADKAVSVFREIIRSGWSGTMTYNNIIVLLQKTGNLESARGYAHEMLNRFPDDYRSYKRMAFLVNASEETKEQKERDYGVFLTYYRNAHDLYETRNTGFEDAEMQILEDLYLQLTEKGWI
ncbi:MAG: protein kinase [Eubacteriales bacterium]|nr:protein kinase [Eubacteriales bacterium]